MYRRNNRRLLSISLLLAVSLFTTGAQSVSTSPANAIIPSGPRADLLPEVRMHRLHLMRPDLIPYPIDYEVVC
jgi:hypothetical protein